MPELASLPDNAKMIPEEIEHDANAKTSNLISAGQL
jgi:hypothetical protein